ncbi:MAG TPA: beta-propeller fold lactonase family protein [Terriglobales bacterium]|nr:beta-propeller fold lactonase family protein [Terriglobales bacterium]
MLKKIGVVAALVCACVLSFFLLSCGSSSSRPSGLLYVLTEGINGIGTNITSYAIDLDSGSLSLINSNASTCQPIGASCGAPLDIVLDPTVASAFVLNQGLPSLPAGPTIYPYNVNSDGSFSAPGTPVTWSSNLDVAVAMKRDAAGQFLFVIDQGASPTPGFPNPSQNNPSCPHTPTSPADTCPSISVFQMTPGSTSLTLAPGSPYYVSKMPTGLSAITYTPSGGTAQELLFVSNNQDVCTPFPQNCPKPHDDNTVSVYSVDSTGALTEQSASPYHVGGANPTTVTALNVAQAGATTPVIFVYVGNNGPNGGDLNPFQLCTIVSQTCSQTDVNAGLLDPLVEACPQPPCNNVPPSAAGQNPVSIVPDPTNNFIYSLAQGSNQVFGFKINTTSGVLTALSPANQPTGSQPVAMALHPSINNTGQFLYTSNSNSANITGFTLSPTSGAMSNGATTTAPSTPTGMAAR